MIDLIKLRLTCKNESPFTCKNCKSTTLCKYIRFKHNTNAPAMWSDLFVKNLNKSIRKKYRECRNKNKVRKYTYLIKTKGALCQK